MVLKKVHPGSYLGVSGSTGRSSGPHLHYEMQKNGVPINPMPFLKSQAKGGGQNKAASKWRGDIQRAAKKNES
ncbi:M23 family metallopeptidase [Staphylococcus warneri]